MVVTHSDDDVSREAMERICATIQNIPFRGLVNGEHEPCTTDHPVDFLTNVADWLHKYRAVIMDQSDTFTRTAAKLRRMEDDRETIREFFLGPVDEDGRYYSKTGQVKTRSQED